MEEILTGSERYVGAKTQSFQYRVEAIRVRQEDPGLRTALRTSSRLKLCNKEVPDQVGPATERERVAFPPEGDSATHFGMPRPDSWRVRLIAAWRLWAAELVLDGLGGRRAVAPAPGAPSRTDGLQLEHILEPRTAGGGRVGR